jgi:hypothetical protein
MGFDKTTVDYEPFALKFPNDREEDVLPDVFVTPPAKPALYRIPMAVTRRHIAPRRTRSQNPKYAIYELTSIFCIAAPGAFIADSTRFDDLPQFIRNVVPTIIFMHGEHPSCVFSIIPHVYCRQALG